MRTREQKAEQGGGEDSGSCEQIFSPRRSGLRRRPWSARAHGFGIDFALQALEVRTQIGGGLIANITILLERFSDDAV